VGRISTTDPAHIFKHFTFQ